MNNTIAIIPARSGSKSVPHKNITDLNGFPMLAYSIAVAKISGIKRVLLSTDCSDYIKIGQQYGAETPFLRPPEYSTDKSSDFDFMNHAMNWIYENERQIPEYWVHLRPTTPLRDPLVIIGAIEKVRNDINSTSLRSGHLATESPLKWFMKDDNDYFKPLLNNLSAQDTNLPRQHFDDVYIPNGYVDIIRSSFAMNNIQKCIQGSKMKVFETEKVDEIDSIDELALIKFKSKNYNSKIFDYLKSHK